MKRLAFIVGLLALAGCARHASRALADITQSGETFVYDPAWCVICTPALQECSDLND